MERETSYSLWAHRIAKSQATKASPFSIVYGTQDIILIDLVRLVVKLTEIAGLPREGLLEILKEKSDNKTIHNRIY